MLKRIFLAGLLLLAAGCEQGRKVENTATVSSVRPDAVAAAPTYGVLTVTRSSLAACASVVSGQPPQVPGHRIVPICESRAQLAFFASGYSVPDMRSIWSAYRLTRPMVQAIEESTLERFSTFIQNPQLKAAGIPQPSHDDYTNNPGRYQRGHYAPSETTKWDEGALRASFQVTNIAPQQGGMNGSIWRCYEETIRGWAKQWGEVQVVVGGTVRTVGSIGNERQITVPSHYFAIVYRPDTSTAVAVAVPNEDGFDLDVRQYMRSVADVEALAGISVGLPPAMKAAPVRFSDWPVKVAQIPFYDQHDDARNACVSPHGPGPTLVSQAP